MNFITLSGHSCAWLVSLGLLFQASVGVAARDEIIFGFNPAENADVVDTNSKEFSRIYQEKIGKKVKTFVATDYTALIEALRSGQVDFAFLPPFSLVKAEQVANAKVLLKSVRKGKAEYYSAIITRADKPFKTVADLKGKSMAWVDPSSAAGHILPKAALMNQLKIDPDKFFANQVFAGSHDALLLSVVNGTVDAGATFSNDAKGTEGSWSQMLKSPEDQKKIRVLMVTPPITGDTVATSAKLMAKDPELIKKTVEFLKELHKTDEGKGVLKALYRIDSLIDAKSSDYDGVRNAAKTVGAF